MSMADYLASKAEGKPYVGPPAAGPCAECGRRPAYRCEGCGTELCHGHWHRHSHAKPFVKPLTTKEGA